MNSKEQKLLVNYALSLQKRIQVDISTQELVDFISGHVDEHTKNKVLAALNCSPDLLQQWVDINQTLGYLKDEVSSEKSGFFMNLMRFMKKPWLIPASAMALGIMVLLPQWIQPSNQEVIDSIYQQWQPNTSQYESLPKGLNTNYAIDNQEELFDASKELGLMHWQQFSQGYNKLNIPNLCATINIENCKSIQTLAVQLGQIQGIVESNCHKNTDQVFWKELEKTESQIRRELKNVVDFEQDLIDFEFCL